MYNNYILNSSTRYFSPVAAEGGGTFFFSLCRVEMSSSSACSTSSDAHARIGTFCGEKECLRLLLFLAFSCIYTSFIGFSLHLCIVCSPFPDTIPHQFLLCFFFFVTFFYLISFVYNLNVDPIVYLSILIYPWSTNLPVNPDHRDREILKSSNHQILLCEEGDSLIPRLAF